MYVDFEDAKPKEGYKYRTPEPSKYNKDMQMDMLNKKRKRGGANKTTEEE